MRPLAASLLKRNTVVFLGALAVLAGVALFTNRNPNWVIVLLLMFVSVFWANSVLINENRPVTAILLSLILVPVLSLPITMVSIAIRRESVDHYYKAQGFRIVTGCNGAAASQADGDVYQFKDLLERATSDSPEKTNVLVDLRKGYALAQEKAKVLDDYCRKAGHVDRHPWKTNWAETSIILRACQDQLF